MCKQLNPSQRLVQCDQEGNTEVLIHPIHLFVCILSEDLSRFP